jgi:hypothetical protein
MSMRNVGLLRNYTAIYPRRLSFSRPFSEYESEKFATDLEFN